jgi:hypothetical protein
MHARSSAKKPALNQTAFINVTGKAFFDVGHSLKDQKLNRRSDHPPCAAWLMPAHAYEGRPPRDHRGVNLIADALPFGRLWYAESNAIENVIDYTKHRSPSHHAMIRVYGEAAT